MAVVEVQLGLPPKTNKKRGSNYITAEEEILVIEEILKYEGTLFGKTTVGIERGHCQRKRVNLEGHCAATLTVDS